MITLVQLEYVLAVEKHRHFGRAASECGVSQPALSAQIAKLEDEAGIILFDRVKKPVVMTDEGRIFIEQARILLREHEKLRQIPKSLKNKIAGEFRLGIIPTVSGTLLPPFVSRFALKYPSVELFIEELKTETILEELAQDRLDGGILATPLGKNELKEHPLFYEPFYLYLSPGHPLLKKARLTDADLEASQMWTLQDGHCFGDQVAQYCSLESEAPPVYKNIHFRSGSLETLRNIVRLSDGYTMIPGLLAEQMNKGERKSFVRTFRSPTPTRTISLVYRRDHWKLAILRAIEDSVRECVPEDYLNFEKAKYRILSPA